MNNILAILSPTGASNTDYSSLLSSASDLTGYITQLIAIAKVSIQKKEFDDKVTGEVEAMLDALNSKVNSSIKSKKEVSGEEINDLIGSLELLFKAGKERQRAANASNRAKQPMQDSLQGKFLLTLISTAASDLQKLTVKQIEKHSQATKPIINTCQNVAAELKTLAESRKSASPSTLLATSRNISQLMNQLAADVKAVAAKCVDPEEQDKLIRKYQVLGKT